MSMNGAAESRSGTGAVDWLVSMAQARHFCRVVVELQ